MHKYTIQFVLMMLCLNLSFVYGQPDTTTSNQTGKLTVVVTGIEIDRSGQLFVSVFSGEENWLEEDREKTKSMIRINEKSKVETVFKKLPLNKEYAVQVYHDENENDELDFGWFPKPEEGVGVSNNIMRMGPPDYEDARIFFTADTTMIINLVY